MTPRRPFPMLTPSVRAFLAGLVWTTVGLSLVLRGFFPFWHEAQAKAPGWALPALGIGLAVGAAKGWFVLRRSAARMIRRIEARPGPQPWWTMYPPYLYLVIPFMIGLGLGLRALWGDHYPSLILGIYVGIGSALMSSTTPFFAAARRLRGTAGAPPLSA